MYDPIFRLRPFHLLLLFALFIVGCGSNPPTPTPSKTPNADSAGNTTTLTLWHTFDDQESKTLEDMVKDFHKVYPELAVDPVYVGSHDDLTKQMKAAIALGTAPDLVLADRRQIEEFASQGGLMSLDKFISDPDLGFSQDDRDDFLRGTLSLGKYPAMQDRTYSFPFHQEALVLFYNKAALKDVNLSQPPATWDEFVQDSEPLTADGKYAWAMRADADTFEAMLASRGSALLTDAETRALFNERAGMNSLRIVADMTDGGAAKLLASDDKARTEFASGKAAFYMGWLSELDQLEIAQKDNKTNFEIGIAPLPQLDPTVPWLLTRGDLFGITPVAPDRARNAWFFIRWMTAPTQSARWVRETDALPLRESALTFLAPDTPSKPHFRQIAQAFNGVLPRLAPQPAHPEMDTIEQAVSGLWIQAVQPKADLRAILDSLADRVDQILSIQP